MTGTKNGLSLVHFVKTNVVPRQIQENENFYDFRRGFMTAAIVLGLGLVEWSQFDLPLSASQACVGKHVCKDITSVL